MQAPTTIVTQELILDSQTSNPLHSNNFTNNSYTNPSYIDQTYTEQSYTNPTYGNQTYTEQSFTNPSFADQTYTEQSYANQTNTGRSKVGRVNTDKSYTNQSYASQSYNRSQINSNINSEAYLNPGSQRISNINNYSSRSRGKRSEIMKNESHNPVQNSNHNYSGSFMDEESKNSPFKKENQQSYLKPQEKMADSFQEANFAFKSNFGENSSLKRKNKII